MKVLIIDNSLDTTGASKALNKMIDEIVSPDCQFVFLYPQFSKNIDAVKQAGFKAYGLPFKEISKSIGNIVLYFPMLFLNTWRVAKIIKKENIDIIHVNDIFNMLGLTAKLITKKKLITHIRRMPESFPVSLYKIWAKLHIMFADKIVAVSEGNKKALPKNSKTLVLYDPLPEAESISSYCIKEQLHKKVNILYLANYTRGKGQEYGIEIIDKASKELPDWKFTLNYYGGDFGLEKNRQFKLELEDEASKKGLSDRINFYNKSEEVEKNMKEHDLIFNLSDSESFSRVTLESLFYGVPVMATDVGGTKEMIPKNFRHLLASPKSVESMYQKFIYLMCNDSVRISYANESFHFVRENFGLKQTSLQLKEIYHSFN